MDPTLRSSEGLDAHRLDRLRALIDALASNAFYAPRLRAAGIDASLGSAGELARRMPFTTKDELARDQREHPPYGTNLTWPLARYARIHRTSSTTGSPLCWLDAPEDWEWMVRAWDHVLEGAGVTADDRVLFAFSFGPFIGFWLGFEAAVARGCLAFSGGALDSRGRLELVRAHGIDVLCCTPTYALRLGEMTLDGGATPASLGVRAVVVAGEPGGSLPATRERIASLWGGARVFDHYGMTEVGPVTFQCAESPETVHVVDTHYLCEVIDPETGEPLPPDAAGLGELVVTTLGRFGSPLLRYRTGDLVRAPLLERCACGRTTTRLRGGILGRADQMVVVRGVNVYPSAVDEVVRAHPAVAEYRVEVGTRDAMKEIEVVVELHPGRSDGAAAALADGLRRALSLRIPVRVAERGALPRFELKARRWIEV